MFSVYVNSSQLTTRVEYFAIIRSRLIAECFVFIFYFNATAADMKKFRVSAYRRINTVYIYMYVCMYVCMYIYMYINAKISRGQIGQERLSVQGTANF